MKVHGGLVGSSALGVLALTGGFAACALKSMSIFNSSACNFPLRKMSD